MDQLQGKWVAEKKDDLAEQMKLMGIPDEFVKYASETDLEWVISVNGDKITMKQVANMAIILEECHFQLGKQFHVRNWLGQLVTGVVVLDGDNMVRDVQEGNLKLTQTFQKKGNKMQEIRAFTGTSRVCYSHFTKA